MQINSINNTAFEAKKFRLIVDATYYDRVDGALLNHRNVGKYVKEYSNPKARDLYNQAQKSTNVKEQIKLYNEMGDFEIKSLNIFEIIREKFKSIVNNFLTRSLS